MSERVTEKGQAIYSKKVLSIYDFWVLGVSNHLFWKCPTRKISNHFLDCVSPNHLDVGVGTGYYLKNYLPKKTKRIALLDMNRNSLSEASNAISHFQPEIYQADVLNMHDLCVEKFDSISVNYLLHCLPGNFVEKSILFENLKNLLSDEGVLFGSTILGKGVEVNFCAQKIMNIYNKKGIFCNFDDDYDSLSKSLSEHFSKVDIRIIGCVALFSCKNKKS
ncbi:class I SAM-dependent methyltransferase [Photobacterium angustum]|uniref:SAM-dependent methyltransferase n=1 Tax=Photobacterium angustum (strain S14 / CCUG 15956) TaxID=314292 RepID=Q1ZPU8_PHOAS|nr:class I SAM-dependent methyltransferase [Photobacterium angustum]EAS64549.1 SAM-dependent methyltransferase [Photobacterium angustum S14]